MMLAIASNSLCQNVPWFGDDPSDEIVVSNGDTFVFRELIGYLPELFTGTETSEPHAHASHSQELAEYLSQPHPSVSTIRSFFSMAAQEFNVPVQILEAIGQVENNWTQVGPSIDHGWGVMHLVQNGYCNTLSDAATLLGLSEIELKNNALQNIRGAAALLDVYATEQGINRNNASEWFQPMAMFSGLINEKLRHLQAKEYYKVLHNGVESYTLWGEVISINGDVHVSIPVVNVEDLSSSEVSGDIRSSDYGPALTDWAASCNYGTGRNHSIDTWVNHWADGTYYGTISWFQTCPGSGAGQRGYDNNGNLIGASSAHFVINNTNGEITQMVGVSNTAWHCGASGQAYNNGRSIGVEHAVQSSNPSQWNSTSMLNASATMACYFQQQYGFPTTQNASPGICGHNDMPGTNTTCPGPLPWATWYSYFNSANCSGSSGGCVPDNDNCSSATLIVSNGNCLSGTVECATGSYGANNCGNGTSSDDNDVYYRFVAQATSHTVTISNYANNFDGVIELRTACASGSGNYISCHDPTGAPTSVSYTWPNLTIGQTYYIRVYEFNSTITPPNAPTFDVCVTHSGGGGEPNLTRVSGISTINVNGNNLDVSIRVINDGGAASGSSTVCYYLSTNTDISSSDYLVGTDNVSSLSVNGTSNESISVDVCTVSPQIPNGTYYVGYIIDCGDDVIESSESDNEFYFVNTQITVNCVAPCTPPSNPSSASASPSTIISGSSSTLSVNGGSLGSNAQWVWYSGSCGGTQVGTGSQISVSPSSTTTYYVQAVGSGNCTGQNTSCVSVTVNVNAPCTPPSNPSSASASPSTINSGSSSTLTVNGGSLGSSSQWIWYGGLCGGTQVGTGSQISVSPSVTTTYYVQAVGSGDCAGQNTSCVSVTVGVDVPCTPTVSVSSSSGNSICEGEQITFTAIPTNGGLNPSYTWTDGGSIVGYGPTWSSSILVDGSHNIQVEMTSTEQCANPQMVYSSIFPLTVNAVPSTPNITPSNPPAGCNSVTLAATPNSGCTYSWTTPNGIISTGIGNQLTATESGGYFVAVTCNGCESSSSNPAIVSISGGPNVTLSGLAATYCEDVSLVNLIGSPTGGTLSGTGVSGMQFSPGSAGPGTYVLEYSYTDGNNCTGVAQEQVTVYASPTANAGSDVTIQPGNLTTLNGTGGVSCSWLPTTALSNPSSCTPTANPGSTITYELTVTDANGCTDTDDVTVTVGGGSTGSAPNADFVASPDSGCVPLTVGFTDLSTNNPTSWSWVFSGATPSSSTDQHPQGIVYNQAGYYTVLLTATNSEGTDTETKVEYIFAVSCTGIKEYEAVFQLYPNPNNGQFELVLAKVLDNGNYQVFDNIGQLVKQGNINTDRTRIDMHGFTEGVYTLRLMDGAESLGVERVVLMK